MHFPKFRAISIGIFVAGQTTVERSSLGAKTKERLRRMALDHRGTTQQKVCPN